MTFPGSEPETIVAMAAEHGFGHLTVQWDDIRNRPLIPRLRAECDAVGLTMGVWCANPSTGVEAVSQTGADHCILQAEQPEPWPEITHDFRMAYPEPFPAAVVTTFWGIGATASGYDPSIAKPVIEDNFKCLTEAYVVSNPNATPAELNYVATQKLGWEASQPVIGVYGNYPAERYVTEHNLASWPGYWVWLAETMTERDWAVLREVNLG